MEKRVPARLSRSEGRRFGLTVGGAFVVLAGIVWWREHDVAATALGTLGALLLVAGVAIPTLLGPVQRGWMSLAHLLSKVTTPVFLGIVYFGVITPIGLLMAAAGRRPMRAVRGATTYWRAREASSRRSDLTRQF